eukprot:TRINITY_DN5349_c0_g1_i2.p1 TRINITY_DN5349_c0_g1~~TRINITY_DN5349_c0_g1_i2.p1  ORF type:complete len:248 (+),score=56.11 TRINITY_DN5349_c0_g1_i2:87-830(+)
MSGNQTCFLGEVFYNPIDSNYAYNQSELETFSYVQLRDLDPINANALYVTTRLSPLTGVFQSFLQAENLTVPDIVIALKFDLAIALEFNANHFLSIDGLYQDAVYQELANANSETSADETISIIFRCSPTTISSLVAALSSAYGTVSPILILILLSIRVGGPLMSKVIGNTTVFDELVSSSLDRVLQARRHDGEHHHKDLQKSAPSELLPNDHGDDSSANVLPDTLPPLEDIIIPDIEEGERCSSEA